MKIKKYRTQSIKDAINLIKKELGINAFILNTKKVEDKSIWGGKTFFEVTAAVEEEKEKPPEIPAKKPEEKPRPVVRGDQFTPLKKDILEIKGMVSSLKRQVHDHKSEGDVDKIFEEIRELKKNMSNLASITHRNDVISAKDHPKDMEWLYRRLISYGIRENYIKKIIDMLCKVLEPLEYEDKEIVRNSAGKIIGNLFEVMGPIELDGTSPKIAAFVGPTGVGKTTTIAKLAAFCSIKKDHSVALITLDTYRIAAVNQLKIYADIIGIPFYVAQNTEEISGIIKQNKDKMLILIDTAGRSSKNVQAISEMIELSLMPGVETHLVLSATTKMEDLEDIIVRYRDMIISSLIFTKLDETTNFGNIFNILADSQKPISYITTGQDVPEDIEVVTKERLSSLFLDEYPLTL